MKIYFIAFGLLLFFGCHTENKQKGTLKVFGKYCKYDFGDFKFSIDKECKLFRGNEKIQASSKDEFTFENISFGDYHLEYITIYNERKKIYLTLDDSLKEISYCADAISYETDQNLLLIDELETNQTLRLHYEEFGCFDSSKSILEITKTASDYILSYQNKKHILSERQLQLFREFEIELYKNHSEICSTIGTYTIRVVTDENDSKNPKIFSIKDGSCSWRGFPNLIALLNLE